MDRNPNKTARKIAAEALIRIMSELQAGRNDSLLNFLGAVSRFRDYSWQNVLLITAQRPDATRVAGIHAWHHLGHSVKASEKGILILTPIDVKEAAPINEPFPRTGFRAAYVFDLSQTEGKPLPEVTPQAGQPEAYRERLQELLAKRVVEPQYAGPVAYAVGRGLGLEDHSPSVSLAPQYTGDSRALARSLSIIQETSAQILDELVPEQHALDRHATETAADRSFVSLDAGDFGKLHLQYRDRLIQSIRGMVRDRDKAEEIAARAFQAAWEKRDGFRGEAMPYTWLQAIARHEVFDAQRLERKVLLDSIDRDNVYDLAAPELVTDELERRDDHFRLQKALGQLPSKHRRALTAHFVEGLSVREIARRERVPFGTVLSRIHKGKQLLREAWERPFSVTDCDVPARGTARLGARQESRAPRPSRSEGPEPPQPATFER